LQDNLKIMKSFEKSYNLDQTDRELIKILRSQGRATAAQLGEAIGLSASAAHRRLKMLEDGGVISGYGARINDAATGKRTTVFVHVTLLDQRRETFEAFEKAVRACAEITEAHLMSGEADYLLRILLDDDQPYEAIHRDALSSMPGVSRLVSTFSIRTIKSL